MTLGISEQVYLEISKDIQALKSKIAKKAEEDKDADRVYQLNFQFFPASNQNIERKKK